MPPSEQRRQKIYCWKEVRKKRKLMSVLFWTVIDVKKFSQTTTTKFSKFHSTFDSGESSQFQHSQFSVLIHEIGSSVSILKIFRVSSLFKLQNDT